MKEKKKNKLRVSMVQAQDHLPVQGHAQSLVLDHVRNLDQDPVHNPDQDLTHVQGQVHEVAAVHADAVPLLVVGHVHIHVLERGEDPDLGLVVHTTTDIKGTCISCLFHIFWCFVCLDLIGISSSLDNILSFSF